ncbi:MAG: hypothetical protein SVM79_08400, partial [Chloroflexota bacterium]|nr:hypothetical protein [Chloroflexota bacterium]
ELGGTVGPVNDDADVSVISPSITIEKTVDFDQDGSWTDSESGDAGDTAHWRVVVTNNGPDPLFNVVITDSNGHDFGLPFDLASGVPRQFDYAELNVTADKTNTAFAQGEDELGGTVGPVQDDAAVQINPGELIIFKYDDIDGEGEGYTPGDGDVGLEDWDFTISGVPGTFSTNSSGLITMTLDAGDYTVTEALPLPPGWTNTDPGAPAPYDKVATVPSGGSVQVNFGNWAPSSCLEIFKYEDANSNGLWEPGEEGLPNWHFQVINLFGNVVFDGYTDENGLIEIDPITTGFYTVVETPKEDWHNTTALEQSVEVVLGPCARVEFGNRENFPDIPPMVPTVSQWGLIAMITLFATSLVWTVRRRIDSREQL